MRLFSGRWLWLDVGMLLASVSLASDAASLDAPSQQSLLRDAYGKARTIRHMKGLMTQQLPSSGLPALPEPGGRFVSPISEAAAADEAPAPETASKVAAGGQAAVLAANVAPAALVGGERAAAKQPRGDKRRTFGRSRNNATSLVGAGALTSQNAELPVLSCKEGKVACPSPNRKNSVQCIAIKSLCNRESDCDGGEDEDPVMCMFYQQIYVDLNTKISEISSQLKELYHYVDQHRHDAQGHVVRPTV